MRCQLWCCGVTFRNMTMQINFGEDACCPVTSSWTGVALLQDIDSDIDIEIEPEEMKLPWGSMMLNAAWDSTHTPRSTLAVLNPIFSSFHQHWWGFVRSHNRWMPWHELFANNGWAPGRQCSVLFGSSFCWNSSLAAERWAARLSLHTHTHSYTAPVERC